MPDVGRKATLAVVARLSTLPIGFLGTLVTTRFLSPPNRGSYVLATLIVSVAATLTGQFGIAAAREIALSQADSRRLVREALAISGIAGSVIALAVLPLLIWAGRSGTAVGVVLCIALPIAAMGQTGAGCLLAVGQVRAWSVVQVANSATVLIAVSIALPVLHAGRGGAIVGWSSAQPVASAFALLPLLRIPRKPSTRAAAANRRRLAGLGLRIGFVNLLSLANYRVELVLIAALSGLRDVGIYALATTLAELVWVLTSSLAAALLGDVVDSGEATAAESTSRAIRLTFAIALATAAIGALLGWFTIVPVFGSRYDEARLIAVALMPGIVAFAPAAAMSQFFTVRLGSSAWPMRAAALSLIVTGAGCAVLLPTVGVVGAAGACSVGYVAGITLLVRKYSLTTSTHMRCLVPRIEDIRFLQSAVLRLGRSGPTAT